MGKVMGSETARAPAGMEMLGEEEKVRGWRVEVRIELTPTEELRGRAIVAEVIGREVVPNALEMRRRNWVVEVEMWMVWRMVVLKKTTPEPF